ncbi:MAG TPA: SufD family Fe-S cluster assembly protein [Acholeplasma sp.]|jgi:Fe-S cluster assembly protein SufD|nr:SufD family Fe-S cluster assembly protein [Acholeplasma sp.]
MRDLECKKTIASSGVYDFVFKNQTKKVTIDVKENIDVTLHFILQENNDFDLNLKLKNNEVKLINVCLEGASKVKQTLDASKSNIKALSCFNSKCDSFNLEVNLKEESKIELDNIIISKENMKQVYDFRINHLSPFTESNLRNYAVTDNNSKLVINNTGFIDFGCKKAEINQSTTGIMLDLSSSIEANPILEINHHDVIANHGASIGALADSDLFYLMSRGISKEEAERIIIEGYYRMILDKIEDKDLKAEIEKRL